MPTQEQSPLEHLQELALRCKVWGVPANFHLNCLTYDKRKQKRLHRELTEAGLIAKVSENLYLVTDKVYDELPAHEPNLVGDWQRSREAWNRDKNYPFVQFRHLLPVEQKYILENGKAYLFYLCDETVLNYRGYQLNEKRFVGPLPLAQVTETSQKDCWEGRDHQVVVSSPALQKHVEEVLKAEGIDDAYRRNARWGFAALGLLTKEETKVLGATDNPLCGDDRHDKPELWEEDFVRQEVEQLDRDIAMATAQITVLRKLSRGVAELGGWARWRELYKERLAAALEKRADTGGSP